MLDLLLYPLAVLGVGVASVLLFLLVTGVCATIDLDWRRSQRGTSRDGATG